jgi:uncharacterized membrane protein (DUF4010 family)
MDAITPLLSALPGLAVALGVGLLIGLERERRKGRGADRAPGGIRTFALAAGAGALAQALGGVALVAVGALTVAALVLAAYWRSPRGDPGLTTELAMWVTYLVGVLAVREPALGAGAGAVVALLLAMRERLHHFATNVVTADELRDALVLAALVLVVLPLTPSEPVSWLGGVRPRTLVLTAVLILLVQAGGHVAARIAGARAGLALAGLASGFVSSTATIASMGGRARNEPSFAAPCEAGAMLSTAATWILALVLLAALAPPLALAMAPAAVAGTVAAAASGAWRAWRAPTVPVEAVPPAGGPLRVREALIVTGLLAAVGVAVGTAARHFGGAGALVGSTLAAIADSHSAVATLANLHAQDRVDALTANLGVLLAITVNAATRIAVAIVAGGRGYGTRVGASLVVSTGLAWAVALATGALHPA